MKRFKIEYNPHRTTLTGAKPRGYVTLDPQAIDGASDAGSVLASDAEIVVESYPVSETKRAAYLEHI